MPPLGIPLPLELLPLVKAGCPVLDLNLLPHLASAEPGRPARLLDERGFTIASGLIDPENELLRILSREPLDTFDLSFFKRRVEAAFRLRKALGLVDGVSAFRLINVEGDDLSGFAADVYGTFGVLYVYSRGLIGFGRTLAQAIVEVLGLEGVVLKVRPKGGSKPGTLKQEIIGREPPESMTVYESGVPYEVHLLGGMNVGLFTDMREHRRGLSRFVKDRRVLNTFCYTGALSVASARFGAKEVTSVDLSSGVLKWTMANFRLSGLNPELPRYRFEGSDVIKFMKAEKEKKAVYDTIILDPPTYSAARANAWSMKNDYPDLIALAVDLLPRDEGGFLWVSANTHRTRGVEKYIEDGLAKAKRGAQVLELGGLPPDYPSSTNWPDGRYLEVCWLRVFPE